MRLHRFMFLVGLIMVGCGNGSSSRLPDTTMTDTSDTDSDTDTSTVTEGDSDGDGIRDVDEPEGDFDGDGKPNYLDDDSDNDGILDSEEGYRDYDEDGQGNAYDLDSDGDGVLDAIEKGDGDSLADSDGDNIDDFLDVDSDNDGLSDEVESQLGTSRTDADSDSDGYDDLTEYVYWQDEGLSQATVGDRMQDASQMPRSDYYYIKLPHDAEGPEVQSLSFTTDIQNTDVLIVVDLSGSMSGEIDNLKSGIENVIIDGIRSQVDNAAFGVATYDSLKAIDSADHDVFKVNQMVTTDILQVKDAVNAIDTKDAYHEPHALALELAASGAAYSAIWDDYNNDGPYYVDVPGADCSSALGTIGGGCFREGSLPVFIMITDEDFWDYNHTIYTWETGSYATLDSAVNAMNAINAKFIGIGSEGTIGDDDPVSDENSYLAIANGTNSRSIATGQPFLYKTAADGTGLSEQITDGVVELLNYLQLDVSTSRESLDSDFDSTQFIKAVAPVSANPADSISSLDATHFRGVQPGAEVVFDVTFHNDGIYVPTSAESRLFKAKINVIGEGALLDERRVYMIVPGVISGKLPGAR